MDRRDVAVATVTWARTAAEADLLRRSLTRLTATGLPIAVADAGTDPSFRDFLAGLPGVRLPAPAARGLVAQVQAGVTAAGAFDTPFILYTEPDKESFFQRSLRRFVDEAPETSDVGVVIASRSDDSFRTYPPMQRETEKMANRLCARVLGTAGDYFYGPFLFSRELLPAFATLPPDIGWGWRPSLFAAARRLGRRIVHLTGDYPCPPDQRDEDARDRAHRLRQLSQNVLGLVD